MKGDFTRFTHRPEKGFTQVRRQQGRVDLDADWNELVDIGQHLSRSQAVAVIGDCGVPKIGGGFKVTSVARNSLDFTISAGKIYVDGLLCELNASPPLAVTGFPANNQIQLADQDAGDSLVVGQAILVSSGTKMSMRYQVTHNDGQGLITVDGQTAIFSGSPAVLQPLISYRHQPHLLSPPDLNPPSIGRTDLIYLDVWQRHITAVEDPEIREVALGGPDTTTRVKTVCQVKVLPDVGSISCDDELNNWPPSAGIGRLSTIVNAPAVDSDPCVVSPGGGYRGLENRLYRVEVHDSSDSGAPTFKWSRDNGSIVFAIEEFIAGEPEKVRVQQLGRDETLNLNQFDWVEISDDATELAGQPGIVAEILDIDEAGRVLTLSKNVSGFDPAGHPKVRRWDMSSDVIKIAPGPTPLEDGIEISFDGVGFYTGDYWTFAARTVTGQGDATIDELDKARPTGIRHHFCRLALVRWRPKVPGMWTANIEDCRPHFPALTDICAEDVCYDDSDCEGLQAQTVQEAIDQLCDGNDLPHHNKHLHGMGIVCGLQVHCGEDDPEVTGDRRTVVLRPGYAIDCEGHDITLEEDLSIDALALIEAHDEENPENPIISEEAGDAVIVIERDENGQPRIRIRPYDPSQNTLQSMLQGTLLMDYLQECILDPLEKLKKLLEATDDNDKRVVKNSRRNLITLLNLIAQFWQPNGPHVYLSLQEHKILQLLYVFVRSIMQSKTYCAMFDDANPFPPYPFPDINMTTIFDANVRTRMRIHPGGKFGYSVGNDAMIHVYDLVENEVVGLVTVPGSGVHVRDVAFSKDGRELYAISTLEDSNTIFATADIRGPRIAWRPMTVLCDCELITLIRSDITADVVLAIGRETGLYVINPDNVTGDISPTVPFKAVGHLEIDNRTKRAFATQFAPDEEIPHADEEIGDRTYDSVIEIDLVRLKATGRVYRPVVDNVNWLGEDDIAVARGKRIEGVIRQSKLFVVTNNPTEDAERSVFAFVVNNQKIAGRVDRDSISLQLGYVDGSNYLALISPDEFTVGLINVATTAVVNSYELPLQMVPVDMAVAPDQEHAYFINAFSQTVTVLGTQYLQPKPNVGLWPGGEKFMIQLMEYREAIFAAFVDLAAGLVQYLKDCFCDRLLIDCPECDDEEVVLGVVSIRGGEVNKVCNFSGRTYVKSFPTVGYWLSLIPIAPLIDKLVQEFCGAAMMDIARRVIIPGKYRFLSGFSSRSALATVSYLQTGLLKPQLAGLNERFSLGGNLTKEWFSSIFQDEVVERPRRKKPALAQRDLVNMPVDEALRRAEAADVVIENVAPYNPRKGAKNLRLLTTLPTEMKRGERLTLYEQDGVVKYYAIASKSRTPEMLQDNIETLQASVTNLQNELNERDAELTTMRSQLEMVEETQATLTKSDPKIAEMETELTELREFRAEVQRFMRRNQ